jgi:hypothetical protein
MGWKKDWLVSHSKHRPKPSLFSPPLDNRFEKQTGKADDKIFTLPALAFATPSEELTLQKRLKF